MNRTSFDPGGTLTGTDRVLLARAYRAAKASYDEGGLPIGAVLAEGEEVLAEGYNRRVQDGDPIAHGEMDCLRRAGRRHRYDTLTLYTTLSPCMMCAGAIVQFGIRRVVVGEDRSYAGNIRFLRERGVTVLLADDPDCRKLMETFIRQKPALWDEDIAGEANA